MSEVKECTRGSHWLHDGVRSAWFKFNHWRDNPTYFYPDGIWVFTGPQGSGKTLSAVSCLYEMVKRYPRARVISNMPLSNFPVDVEVFEDYSQLSQESNGIEGIIFFLDEIHVLWNSLESKDIPISEMASFCQMRKDRRVIIGTSQVYGRIAKPIREQLKYLIDCHNLFGVLQINDVCDPSESTEIQGHIHPNLIYKSVFFHSPELYTMYETLNKIERAKRTLTSPNDSYFFKGVRY